MEIPYKEIITWGLGLFSAYLMYRVQSQRDRIKTIENQLSDKKYKMYSELIYIFFDVTNNPDGVDQDEVQKKILYIKREMFLYAPDHIFIKFTDWVTGLNEGENSTLHFKKYFELLKLIRKEMGYPKTKLSLDDFMLFYMQNKHEYEKFKELYKW